MRQSILKVTRFCKLAMLVIIFSVGAFMFWVDMMFIAVIIFFALFLLKEDHTGTVLSRSDIALLATIDMLVVVMGMIVLCLYFLAIH